MWRSFKRLFIKDENIKDKSDNKQEMLRWSVVKYMWNYNKRVQPIIKELKLKYPDAQFYEVANDKELAKPMNSL